MLKHCLTALAGVVACALPATADIQGPFFPPPSDAMFMFTSDGGRASITGGVTFTFTGHDPIEMARGLYYGNSSEVVYAASLDGPVETGEEMVFDSIGGVGMNTATWLGMSQVYVFDGSAFTPQAVPTRFTITVEDLSGDPIAFMPANVIDPTFPSGADAAVRVRDDFRATWHLDAFYDGAWSPMDTLYDSLLTPPPGDTGHGTASTLGSGYYTGDLCPVDTASPSGVLDLADIVAFITAFSAGEPTADLAAPFGVFDLADLNVFIELFQSGCP